MSLYGSGYSWWLLLWSWKGIYLEVGGSTCVHWGLPKFGGNELFGKTLRPGSFYEAAYSNQGFTGLNVAVRLRF